MTEYIMGRSDNETGRLILQGEIYRQSSRRMLSAAGISRGMRVLDVGCGAGDITELAAELVGPNGSVLGIDSDPAILDLARSRSPGRPNVEFRLGTIPGVDLGEIFDAVVGRLILLHVPDQVATLRALSNRVRIGGIINFHEFNIARTRAVPELPLLADCIGWICDAMRATSVEPDNGELLHRTFRRTGLHIAVSVASLLPLIEQTGVATIDEIKIDTLDRRLAEEAADADAVLYSPEIVSVWAQVGPNPVED